MHVKIESGRKHTKGEKYKYKHENISDINGEINSDLIGPDKKRINVRINDQDLTVPEGITILEAAHRAGVRIPTLCHLDLHDLQLYNKTASCRVCMVEVVDERNNRNKLVPSCVTKLQEGMAVRTDTRRAITARRMAVELLLSNHLPQKP